MEDPYKLVILGNILIALEYLFITYGYVLRIRRQVFTGKFLKQFSDEHKKATGNPRVPDMGYPDTGNGWYSQKLPYADWFLFNCVQRIHINFLEGFTLVVLVSLVGGIQYPVYAFYGQLIYILGRALYSHFYYMRGHDAILIGSLLMHSGLLANLTLAVKSCLNMVE